MRGRWAGSRRGIILMEVWLLTIGAGLLAVYLIRNYDTLPEWAQVLTVIYVGLLVLFTVGCGVMAFLERNEPRRF